ncbi:MAG: transcriptional repressor [Verrucomicrobia bacterium]|nr:transcriptional repressor [Verrucomicrobiota bacterium]
MDHKHKVEERVRTFAQACKQSGIPLTSQRRLIFEALLCRTDHPTADRIYQEIRRKLPGTSRTTVYRTLRLLTHLGQAQRVAGFGDTTHFDGDISSHHHFTCTMCGRITDVENPGLALADLAAFNKRMGCAATGCSVSVVGTCKECRSKQKHVKRQTYDDIAQRPAAR